MDETPVHDTPPPEMSTTPDRHLLAKMAVVGLAAMAIGGAGATLAAASMPTDPGPEPPATSPVVEAGTVPVDVEFVEGLPVDVDKLAGILGLGGGEPDLDGWNCPPCGMG